MKWIYYTFAFLCLCTSAAKAQIYDFREFKHLLPKENDLLLFKSFALPLDSQNLLLNSWNLPNSQNKATLFTKESYQENTYKAFCSTEKTHWKTLATYLEEGRAAQQELLVHLLQKVKVLATEVFSLKEEIHLLNTHANQLLRNTKLKCRLGQLENSPTPCLHDTCISAQVSSEDSSKLSSPPQNRKEDANLLHKESTAETMGVFFPHLNFINSSELFSL